ncbi:MAG: YfaZ family outer membrane protein [Gammaproteobacteria bacterium]
MVKKIIFIVLFFSYCTAPFAAAINAQLSNDSARFMYTGGAISTRLQFEGGAIYTENDILGVAGLLVSGENLDAPVVATLGIRGYFGEVTNSNSTNYTVSAIALGGDLAFSPVNLPGFEFGGYYYIAPSPVAYGDIDKFVDFGVRVGYQVIPLTTLFIGYQSITVEVLNFGKYTIDEGIIFGMNFTF